MNNSFFAQESITLEVNPPVDISEKLRTKEAELLTIIEAIETIADSREWKVLKEKIFDNLVEAIKHQRDMEIEKKPFNASIIHSLNGQLTWATKYSDFAKLSDIYKSELQNVRKHLDAT